LQDGWSDALVSFMLSGGFSPSAKVPTIQSPSLILWGRQDTILDIEFAQKFLDTLPSAELRWVEDCGHVPHLEQPEVAAEEIAKFLLSDKFVSEKPTASIIDAKEKMSTPILVAGGLGAVGAAAAVLLGSM